MTLYIHIARLATAHATLARHLQLQAGPGAVHPPMEASGAVMFDLVTEPQAPVLLVTHNDTAIADPAHLTRLG